MVKRILYRGEVPKFLDGESYIHKLSDDKFEVLLDSIEAVSLKQMNYLSLKTRRELKHGHMLKEMSYTRGNNLYIDLYFRTNIGRVIVKQFKLK